MSLAAVFSGFSENENSWRTWSTGLDLILCIKIDFGGHRVQLMNSLLLLFGRREWQMTFPTEKSGEKRLSARRDRWSLSSPDRFFPGKRQFLVPFKDIYISRTLEREREVYPCTNYLLLSSFEYQSLSITRIKGYVCSFKQRWHFSLL